MLKLSTHHVYQDEFFHILRQIQSLSWWDPANLKKSFEQRDYYAQKHNNNRTPCFFSSLRDILKGKK
jgi:hypothetical protein